MIQGEQRQISYDVESLTMAQETWCFNNSGLAGSTLAASIAFELQSLLQFDLEALLYRFVKIVFLQHHAQGFPTHILQRAYLEKWASLTQTFCLAPRFFNINAIDILSSPVLYTVKLDKGNVLPLKTQIAPPRNIDSMKYKLKSDWSIYAAIGFQFSYPKLYLKSGVYIGSKLNLFLHRLEQRNVAFTSYLLKNLKIYIAIFGFCSQRRMAWWMRTQRFKCSLTLCFLIWDCGG